VESQREDFAGALEQLLLHDAAGLGGELAAQIAKALDATRPDEPTVRLSLTDDVFRRSSTLARWPLGIPLPWEGRAAPRALGGVRG
jgi:hypothetical protein